MPIIFGKNVMEASYWVSLIVELALKKLRFEHYAISRI